MTLNHTSIERHQPKELGDPHSLEEAEAVPVHCVHIPEVCIVHLHLLAVQHLKDDHPIEPDVPGGYAAHLPRPHKAIQQSVALAHLWAGIESPADTNTQAWSKQVCI